MTKDALKKYFTGLLSAVLALVAVPAAFAQETDRVRIGGSNTTIGFSQSSFVSVTTLPGYSKTGFDGDAGGWEGPFCAVPANPTLSGNLALTWGVGFYKEPRTADAVATAALTFEWTPVERGTVEVPHLIRGRRVGTIRSSYVITDSGSQQGWHESGLGIPLGRGVFSGAAFWSRGVAFRCFVGTVPSEVWHRQTARQVLDNIAVEGNLPPARVTARARGRRVGGEVTDSFGHPLAGVAVTFERRAGRAWLRAGRTVTDAAGRYSARPRRGGVVRAVVSFGFSVRSGAVRVRP